jgi:hypothetical protein
MSTPAGTSSPATAPVRVVIDLADWLVGAFEPTSITITAQLDPLSPAWYRALFGERHPRVSRMHRAYKRRRRYW